MVEPSKKTRNGLEINPLEGSAVVKVVISEGSRLESIHHPAHCPGQSRYAFSWSSNKTMILVCIKLQGV